MDEHCIFGLLVAIWNHLYHVHFRGQRLRVTYCGRYSAINGQNFSLLEPNNLYCHESTGKHSQCLKIAQKVAFNIASEASNVYILSGQKLLQNAKNGQKCPNSKIEMRHFE